MYIVHTRVCMCITCMFISDISEASICACCSGLCKASTLAHSFVCVNLCGNNEHGSLSKR